MDEISRAMAVTPVTLVATVFARKGIVTERDIVRELDLLREEFRERPWPMREKTAKEIWKAAEFVLSLRHLIVPVEQWRDDLFDEGGVPSIGVSGSRSDTSARGIDPRRPSVYGIRGRSNRSSTDAVSTMVPAYITATRSATPAITPRSWVMSTIAAPVAFRAVWSTSRICAWIVTSSAVVGSSAIRSFGLVSSAMAMTMRWRMPPESSCG